MGNTTGWSLTGRLLAKHFGSIGDSIASMIAGFDPETATQADRDSLADSLRRVAEKYVRAKSVFEKEQQDVVDLKAAIARDENVAGSLVAKLTAGQIDEATAMMFADELQAEKERLPQEVREEADARAFMDEIKAIVDELSARLGQFDSAAAKAKAQLAQAESQLELQRTRQEQQEQLQGLRGASSPSTGMGALQKRANDLREKAAAMQVVTDIGSKPAESRAKLDALRKSVAEASPAGGSSAIDRLRALSSVGQPA
jgi:DNA repair exonuclease SbcCD ATPase subunit